MAKKCNPLKYKQNSADWRAMKLLFQVTLKIRIKNTGT